MSNTLLTDAKITYKALEILENELTFTKRINREYDDQFAQKGAKIGATANVRKPVRYIGRRTETYTPQATAEDYVPVTLDTMYGCDFTFSEKERTLSLDDFGDRILKPAVATVANMIDYDGLQLYKYVYNHVGTPGTTPNANLTFLQGGALLNALACPNDGLRSAVLNPLAQATMADAQKTLFNPQAKLGDVYEKGLMGKDQLGFDWYMDQNVAMHTIGDFEAAASGAGTAVTTTSWSGTSLVTGGWNSGDLLKIGDVITVAGCYSVNPQSRQSTGQLAQFVVAATPTAASGGGAMTITLDRTPVFTGAYQDVTASGDTMPTSAIVTVFGAEETVTPQNLLFHRDFATFATADLEKSPGAVNQSRVSSKKLGMSILMTPFFDGINLRTNYRLDLLGGWKVLRPELACRVSG